MNLHLCPVSDISELFHEIWPPYWFLTQKAVFQSAGLVLVHLEYSGFTVTF